MSGTTGDDGTPKRASWRDTIDFEALVDGIPALIFICDAGGACVFANSEVQRATGLAEGDWLGEGWISVIHREDRTRVARAWGRAITANEPFELEYRIKTAAGEHDWYLVRARPVRENRRIVYWIGHATDIDDRRREGEVKAAKLTAEAERNEAERRQAEEFAARLIDANADCIKTLTLDGRLLTVNAAGAAASAMDLEDVFLGRSWIGRWPTAEGRALAWNAVNDAAKGGIGRFTAPFVSASGERRWWNMAITPMRDAQGEVQTLLCVSRDVTEGREALERLELITSTVSEGFYQYDWENWRLLYASPAYEKIWGRPVEAFQGNAEAAYRRCIHPDDYQAVEESWARIGLGESRRIEFRIIHPAGEVRWVRDLAHPICDDHGKVIQVVGAVEDITEARKTEERLRLIAETVREGFYITDIATGQGIYSSPAADEIWGRRVADTLHIPFVFLDWVHPEDRPILEAAIASEKKGKASRSTYRILRPDGEVRVIRDMCYPVADENGRLTRVVGVIEDVTEVLRTEEQLRLISETVQEGFYQTNLATGCSLYSSPGCDRILGRSTKILEREPATYLDWVHPEDRRIVRSAMEREHRGEPNRVVYRIVRPDGGIRWVRDLNHPVLDARGQAVQTVGTIEDITEVKEAEARAEAASQERYRSIFELAAVGIARVSLEGRIIEANQRLCGILERPMQDLLTLTAQDIAHPDDFALSVIHTQEILRGEHPSFSMPIRYLTPKGTWVETRLSVSPAYDDAGRPDHLVSVVTPSEGRERRSGSAAA